MRPHIVLLSIFISFALVAAESAATAVRVTSAAFKENTYDNQIVQLEGIIQDVFRDEIDPKYLFAVLEDDAGEVYISFTKKSLPIDSLADLNGCKVSVIGFCRPHNSVNSRHLGHELNVSPPSGKIAILEQPKTAPFAFPLFVYQRPLSPSLVNRLGKRRILGRVLARRRQQEFLLLTDSGHISRVELQGNTPPSVGETVEVVGSVETDAHYINFSQALWRPAEDVETSRQDVTEMTARKLLFNENGATMIKIRKHGQQVRIRCVVRSLPDPDHSDRVLFAESDGVTFPIDASNCHEVFAKLEIGATIEATGICWMEIENWRPNAVFPKVKGFTLVLRTADDITVIARPSWWTPARLLTVIGALLAALLGFVIWNRALQKVAERRGRQLFREQATRMAAELKTAERSRLAVELHDSISQVLTGVALKLKASQSQVKTDPDKALNNLNIAESTLRSSREELRYCLWDLRNNILDLPNLEEAIRQTLKPQIGDVQLAVRFPVTHRKLSDNTVHVILQIVRELAVNAIRHGQATAIRIAGTFEQGVLAFSVQDNGSGFDPTTALGPEQGHFGLLGVQDRLAHYDGTIDLQSAPGKGTKAVIKMTVSSDDGSNHS